MGTTIQEVLSPNRLLGAVKVIDGDLPVEHLPQSLLSGPVVTPVDGENGYIIRGAGTNRVAKQAMKGSASRPMTVSGIEKRPQVLIHSASHFEVKFATLQGLTDPRNGMEEQLSTAEVARQLQETVTLRKNLRTACITSAFVLGKIYFDGNGNLLPSSSGAVITVDYQIPSGNTGDVGGIRDASWATASTKVMTHIQQIHKLMMVKARRRIGCAIYGSAIYDYLLNNTTVKAYLAQNPIMQNSFYTNGMIPNGFGGIPYWYPGDMGFYEDASGTTQTLCPTDGVTFFPAPAPDWYQLQEGIEPVPTNAFGHNQDFEALMKSCQFQRGMWQYGTGETDPLRAKVVFGDNFLPAIHVPETVIILDAVP